MLISVSPLTHKYSSEVLHLSARPGVLLDRRFKKKNKHIVIKHA